MEKKNGNEVMQQKQLSERASLNCSPIVIALTAQAICIVIQLQG